MAKKEVLAFYKNAKDNIDDCSSPIQLRGYFNKFRGKIMQDDIRREFILKIEFFKKRFDGDKFFFDQLESLLEDIEFETLRDPEFINIENNNQIDISPFEPFSEDSCPIEEELLRELFIVTHGVKSEVLRILGTNSFILNRKIHLYNLNHFIVKLRRSHRESRNLARQFPDI